jgi:hypothetical protein
MVHNLLWGARSRYQLAEFLIELFIYVTTSWYFTTSISRLWQRGEGNMQIPFLNQMEIMIFKLSLVQSLL